MPVEPWQSGQQRPEQGPWPKRPGPVPSDSTHPGRMQPPPSLIQPWQAGMRAAQADRDRTVDVLRSAYGEGRLDEDEHAARTQAALQAKTYGELSQLIADLPAGPFGGPPPAATAAGPVQPLPNAFRTAPAPERTNAMAVGSLVCGLVQPFCGGVSAIPAVILGHVSKNQMRSTGEEGDGMATAGLVLGWLGVAVWMMIGFVIVMASGL